MVDCRELHQEPAKTLGPGGWEAASGTGQASWGPFLAYHRGVRVHEGGQIPVAAGPYDLFKAAWVSLAWMYQDVFNQFSTGH